MLRTSLLAIKFVLQKPRKTLTRIQLSSHIGIGFKVEGGLLLSLLKYSFKKNGVSVST